MTQPFAGGLFPIPEEGFTTTSSNLTPDVATGIGNWTEAQFMTAMRTGVRPDGTVMLPFMPWPVYDRWSKGDLRAVWLYLQSLEPIVHEVPVSTLTDAAATGKGTARGQAVYITYSASLAMGIREPVVYLPLIPWKMQGVGWTIQRLLN